MINVNNIICGYEYEIVGWIRYNYKELGYDKILEENNNKVPDFVMLRDGKKVKVEVEIYAKSFIKHKHNPKDVDEVLCVINDVKLPVKTIKIKQLKLWYQLVGDDLIDFFKECPDSILIHHKNAETIYHFQDDWLNLSKEKEESIRKGYRIEAEMTKRNNKRRGF